MKRRKRRDLILKYWLFLLSVFLVSCSSAPKIEVCPRDEYVLLGIQKQVQIPIIIKNHTKGMKSFGFDLDFDEFNLEYDGIIRSKFTRDWDKFTTSILVGNTVRIDMQSHEFKHPSDPDTLAYIVFSIKEDIQYFDPSFIIVRDFIGDINEAKLCESYIRFSDMRRW